MITKEERERIRSRWRDYGPIVVGLCDAIDEMERERDAALKSRIVAMEVRPGDSIVYHLRGATEIVISGEANMEHVKKHVRAVFDEAGFAGVKVVIIDAEDDVSVLRPVSP